MAKKTVKKTKPVKKKTPAVKKRVVAKPAPKKVAAKKAAPVKKTAAKKAQVKPLKVKKAAAPVAKVMPKKTVPKPTEAPKKAKAKVEAVEETVVDVSPQEGVEDEAAEEVVLTDAEGRRYCRVKDCDQLAVVDGYCRFHYLLYWKKIQIRKKILSEGKLERYIEELTARYPDKFLDMLRKDLRSEKEFLAAIQEMEIDESAVDNEFEDETQTYIDEVRGMGEPTGAREEEDF